MKVKYIPIHTDVFQRLTAKHPQRIDVQKDHESLVTDGYIVYLEFEIKEDNKPVFTNKYCAKKIIQTIRGPASLLNNAVVMLLEDAKFIPKVVELLEDSVKVAISKFSK